MDKCMELTIRADSPEEAREIAKKEYPNGNIVQVRHHVTIFKVVAFVPEKEAIIKKKKPFTQP